MVESPSMIPLRNSKRGAWFLYGDLHASFRDVVNATKIAELKDVDLVNRFFLVCFDNTFS